MLLLKTVAKAFPAGCLLEIQSPKVFDGHIKMILLTLLLIFQSWKWVTWLWTAAKCADICICFHTKLPWGRLISLDQRGEQFSSAWLRGSDWFRWANPGHVIHITSDINLLIWTKQTESSAGWQKDYLLYDWGLRSASFWRNWNVQRWRFLGKKGRMRGENSSCVE